MVERITFLYSDIVKITIASNGEDIRRMGQGWKFLEGKGEGVIWEKIGGQTWRMEGLKRDKGINDLNFYAILRVWNYFSIEITQYNHVPFRSFLLPRGSGLLLSQKHSLMLLLVDPQIRILHEILLLLSILILRHGPEIEILILSRLGLLPLFFLLLALSGLGWDVAAS